MANQLVNIAIVYHLLLKNSANGVLDINLGHILLQNSEPSAVIQTTLERVSAVSKVFHKLTH